MAVEYLGAVARLPDLTSLHLFGVCVGVLVAFQVVKFLKSPISRAVNYHLTDITYTQAKLRCCANPTQVIQSGLAKSGGRPFYAIMSTGPILVLPHTYVREVDKHIASLSPDDALNREFHCDRNFPELEPFYQPNEYKRAFAHRIKQGIDDSIALVAEEVPGTLRDVWGEHSIAQRREIAIDAPFIISRLSARVFVGEDLCRNDEWVQITLDVARIFTVASIHLHLVPSFLRPLARHFLPSCRQLTRTTDRALGILEPAIERRRALKQKDASLQFDDAIEWFERIGYGKGWTPMHPQLQLVLASAQTAGDFFMQVVNNLCLYPDVIEPLRKEAAEVVLKNNGSLTTTALKELHLMDSVLKETLRLKPTSPIIMNRRATRDVTFPDGTHIPANTYVGVSQLHLWDDDYYPNAQTFVPDRFVDKAQFVTQSTDNFCFGYGNISCAGRFFAAYEMKIALVHMILKYDFGLAPESPVPDVRGIPAGDYIRADDRVVIDRTLVTSDEERFKIKDRAWELGVWFWDSAAAFNDNEELIGRWLKRNPERRDDIFLCSKFGLSATLDNAGKYTPVIDSSPANCRQSCEESLRKLGLERIDLFYVHRFDKVTPVEKTMGVLVSLQREGKIKHIGFSECSSDTLRRGHAVAPISAVQIEYNPWTLDTENETGTNLRACRELGVSIVTYSPLGRGFLTRKFSSLDDFDEKDARRQLPRFSPENFPKNLELVEVFKDLALQKGCTPSQVVLAWIMEQGLDFMPIPGTKNIKYLEENLGATKVRVSAEENKHIRDVLTSTGGAVGDRNINSSNVFANTPPL
ncbi:MAG: hypothetical protein Q9159_004487 [Coniocarpon cinnabarinum]